MRITLDKEQILNMEEHGEMSHCGIGLKQLHTYFDKRLNVKDITEGAEYRWYKVTGCPFMLPHTLVVGGTPPEEDTDDQT